MAFIQVAHSTFIHFLAHLKAVLDVFRLALVAQIAHTLMLFQVGE